jgi:hypothetical protein
VEQFVEVRVLSWAPRFFLFNFNKLRSPMVFPMIIPMVIPMIFDERELTFVSARR